MWKLLTSPLAGIAGSALSLILAVFLMTAWISHTGETKALERKLQVQKDLNGELALANATLKGNAAALEMGLNTCGKSVQDAADFAGRLTKAGETALAEVQKAGASVNRKINAIDAMPAATCDDAVAILKAGGN